MDADETLQSTLKLKVLAMGNKRYLFALLPFFLVLSLPLMGVVLFGPQPMDLYFEFPPKTIYIHHPGFSPLLFWPLAGASFLFIGIGTFYLTRLAQRQKTCQCVSKNNKLPWWGISGLILLAGTWILAWNRFHWFSSLQIHTFTPLWLGYILSIDGLLWSKTGRSPLCTDPRKICFLFYTSTLFWWSFEWLNRFVQNWIYLGIQDLSPLEYFCFSSLAFSTVLPAVYLTKELISTWLKFSSLTKRSPLALNSKHLKIINCAGLGISAAVLFCLGIWPSCLFGLLWIAPLTFITCWQALLTKKTIFHGLKDGNWQDLLTWPLAALVCGFFWEMWNFKSQAKWIYHIPYLQGYKLFEMPVLGYLGYLPFGWECYLAYKLLVTD